MNNKQPRIPVVEKPMTDEGQSENIKDLKDEDLVTIRQGIMKDLRDLDELGEGLGEKAERLEKRLDAVEEEIILRIKEAFL